MKNKIFNLNIEICRAKRGGYTIIETMISVSLFLVIIVSGMGALLNANLLHQKSRDIRSIMDNLSFIMEDMSRNLRTGYNFHCYISSEQLSPAVVGTPKSCGAGGWAIAFEHGSGDPDDNNDQWIYYIGGTGTAKIFKTTYKTNSAPFYVDSDFVQLTPDEVEIDPLSSFVVIGAEPPPNEEQPFVTIKLVGKITYKNIVTPFSLQTSVSQRAIDI